MRRKTQLSELVRKAKGGEEIIITSGRNRTPVAKLEAIEPREPKRLAARYNPDYVLPDSFWEPLPEDELRLWEGGE